MHAVTRAHDVRTDLARFEPKQSRLELRGRVTPSHLAKTTAVGSRGTGRKCSRDAVETFRRRQDFCQYNLGLSDGLGVSDRIVLRRLNQDVQIIIKPVSKGKTSTGIHVSAI